MPLPRASMPNLRKRDSEPIYNDDKVFEQLERKRKEKYNGSTPKVNGAVNGIKQEVQYTKIPEYVYADDGRKFYPCLYCCHAFAFKEMKLIHMQQCTFRTSSEVSEYVKVEKKPHVKKLPRVVHKKVKAVIKPKIKLKMKKHVPFNVVVKTEPGSTTCPEPKKKKPKVKSKPRYKLLPKRHPDEQRQPCACPECGLAFAAVAQLQNHRRQKHIYPRVKVSADELEKFDEMYKNSDMTKCTICGRPTKRWRWARHLNTHLGEKNYSCHVCGKGFARKDNRDVHLKRRTCGLVVKG